MRSRAAGAKSAADYPERDGEPMAETDAHREEILEFIEAVRDRYRDRDDVYIAGNLFIYPERGNPHLRFAPDAFVVFGVAKRRRRTFRVWEEGAAPSFVLEVSSRQTWVEDAGNKKALCAALGVAEYVLYDPEGDYLRPPLQMFRLRDGTYRPVRPGRGGSVASRTLGLRLFAEPKGKLRLLDAGTGERLLRSDEARAELRASQAEIDRLRAQLRRKRKAR